jgi:hypothetical protein
MSIIIPVLPKSNNTTGSAPTTGTTAVGELALNTYDGVLYTQINVGGTKSIVVLGGPLTFTGDATGNGRPAANIALTLKNTGTAGTYTKVTTDAQGRVSGGTSLTGTDVNGALGYTAESTSNKGVANGYASLDSGGKLTAGQIPASLVGALVYQGTWNASTNTPTLASGTGTKGFYYKVSVAGTTTIDGISSWSVGDDIVFDGTVWDKIDGQANEVISVAGHTGVVTLALSSDLTDITLTSIANGQVLTWNSTSSKWVNTTLGGGTGTVTSVSSADSQISVSNPGTTPILQLNPANMNLAAIGGSLTASQLAPSGTNGYVLQTVAGAAAWTPLTSLGLLGSATPLIDGTAAAGTAATASRVDHVHPTDTSRAPLASPSLTGTPLSTTAAANTNTTQIATTAFVVGQAGTGSPVMNGTATVGTSLLYSRQDHVHPSDTSRAPLASPTLTGTPAAPTAAASTSTTQIATTAFVIGQASSATPLMDGTGGAGTGTTFARADHVHPTDTSRAANASPALTGTPSAPTPATTDNSTTLATTAFVVALLATVTGGTY